MRAPAQPPSRGLRPLLAIVPARGGSKGVPQKNLRLLGDRPLIAYTAEAILASGVADRMVVSSDSDEVLRWAELHGYEASRRPAELSGDDTTLSDVAAHVADELEWEGDVGVFQPTSPFRTSDSIVTAVDRFRAADVDSLATATRVHDGLWLYENGDTSFALPLFKERALHRAESRQPVLRETARSSSCVRRRSGSAANWLRTATSSS